MFNEDLTAYRVRPDRQQAEIYRNAAADEIIFIHHGQGILRQPTGGYPIAEVTIASFPELAIIELSANPFRKKTI